MSTPQPSTATVFAAAPSAPLCAARIDAPRHPADDGQPGAAPGPPRAAPRPPCRRASDGAFRPLATSATAAVPPVRGRTARSADRRSPQQRRIARGLMGTSSAPVHHLLLLDDGVFERAAAGDRLRDRAGHADRFQLRPRRRKIACGVLSRSIRSRTCGHRVPEPTFERRAM